MTGPPDRDVSNRPSSAAWSGAPSLSSVGLVFSLRVRRRGWILGRLLDLRRLAQPLLELPHRLPEIPHHLGEATRAEDQQDHHENDEQLANSHAGTRAGTRAWRRGRSPR